MLAIRYVGTDTCTAGRYKEALTAPENERLILDSVSSKPNLPILGRIDGSPAHIPMQGLVRDLRDMAAVFYAADELTKRIDSADQWTRDFRFLVPTPYVSAWSRASDQLSNTLGFLSGDSYSFDWVPSSPLPEVSPHRQVLPRGFDKVCLFSGGVDSLLGAYSELKRGSKVLLVSHKSSGGRVQRLLYSKLRILFGNNVRLVQFSMRCSHAPNRLYPLPSTIELTHRTRSFLFLSLAVVVASAAGIGTILMPENGLIALNAPLQKSRLGSLSTRTAHPAYLERFMATMRALGIGPEELKNPFLYESKTDMARVADRTARDLLLSTESCAHPSKYNNHGVRHCGYCVPCIYRRAAFIAAGIDSPSAYYRDVFKDLPLMSAETQNNFRALVSFAARIVSARDLEVDSTILSHGFFSPTTASQFGLTPTATLQPWRQMLKRWSGEFLAVVDTNATIGVKGIVGP